MKFVLRFTVGWARTSLACTCVWIGNVLAAAEPAAVPTEISSFGQFDVLTPQQALHGVPVRIKGVVLCFDPGWNQLYVHDGAETEWLSPTLFQTNLQAGLMVEITGGTTLGQGGAVFTNLHLQILGQGRIPPPKRLAIPQLSSDLGEWVEIKGRVRVAETGPGRLSLVVQDKRQICLVYVMGLSATNHFSWLRGCYASIRGINASQKEGGRLTAASLFAPSLAAVTVLDPPDTKSIELPVTSVEALLDRELGGWTNEPVHLQGLLTAYKPGEFLVVKDPTGSIRANVVQTTGAQIDGRVDVWGYLAVSSEDAVLRDAYFEMHQPLATRASSTPSGASLSNQSFPLQEITRFSEVSKLRPEQAAQGFPVRLQGTITYADSDWCIWFIQGRDGAICIDQSDIDARAGQWVEVTGRTSPGGFAPEVVNATLRVLASTNLPEPVKTDLEDLANGHLDSHWVQLEGVVRQITGQWGHVTLLITTPQGRFKAIVPNSNLQAKPADLIDALVSVRGVCTSEMNARGQLTGIVLQMPDYQQITILQPAPADPFAVPPTAIGSVATFDPARLAGRRVNVRGSVTHVIPGQGFYLQDVSGGIRVNCVQTNNLQAGDTVDVLGFPAIGDFSPYLEEASCQLTGSNSLPRPQPTSAEEIMISGAPDATLVQVEGQLIQNIRAAIRTKLVLQSGPIIFTATVTTPSADRKLPGLQIGSILRLVGVCSIQRGESHEPEAFRLLVASSPNVMLLRSPPWWTMRYTVVLVVSLALGLLLAWGWSKSLRRRVAAQTEIIRRNEQELITVSRQAGMAEVATAVLHNVGNVLNSANVSATLVAEGLREFKIGDISLVAAMMKQHAADLGSFMTHDPKGCQVPDYLAKLGEYLVEKKRLILVELQSLTDNVEHIKDIVAKQQSHAKFGGVAERIIVTDLIDDALQMNGEVAGRDIKIVREFEPGRADEIVVERHKVLQILVNLISNAKHACAESGQTEKRLTIRLAHGGDRVKFSVTDNGVGIPRENLTRIFTCGFTTRKSGHGFGLHNAALVAQEIGGSLLAQSEGPGKGATFVLELPLTPNQKTRFKL